MRLMAQRVGPSGRVTRHRRRRAARRPGAGDAARRRPSPVRLRPRRPDRRRAGSGRSVRPRLRAAAALPPAAAGRRAAPAMGRRRARRPPARPGLRPAQLQRAARRSRASTSASASCVGAFSAAGCDVHVGAALPQLFARSRASARPTAPTSPAGSTRSPPPRGSSPACSARSCRPRSRTASRPRSAPPRGSAAVEHDAQRFPDRPALWPLLIGAWKRKPAAAG